MSLSTKQIAEIVQRYNGGDGDDVVALAAAFEVTPAAIRYQLKKAGAYSTGARDDDEAISPSDADLGIGESDEAPADVDVLAAILKNPTLSKLIDDAVAARVAQLGNWSAPAAVPDQTTAVVKAIEHLLDVQSQQMPGYIKPICAAEMDRRATGHVEMLAQIARAEQRYKQGGSKEWVPHYILGEMFFECSSAILYAEGQEIRTFIQPSEKFVPMNEPARLIHAAMITWIGGESPDIGARVAEAMTAAKEHDVPLVTGAAGIGSTNPVEIVPSSKRHDVRPQRVLGTINPETRGTSMPSQPGITQQPAGPVFVG